MVQTVRLINTGKLLHVSRHFLQHLHDGWSVWLSGGFAPNTAASDTMSFHLFKDLLPDSTLIQHEGQYLPLSPPLLFPFHI